jgi:hypothetical protein
MANTGIVNLNPHFMSPRRRNLDILNHEILSSFPGNCGLCDASAEILTCTTLSIPPLSLN